MKKGFTIVYPEYGGLYVNLTNRCPCACTFCIRNGGRSEFDNVETLWLEREPTAEEVVAALREEASRPSFAAYREIVFCGYGEPTERLEVLLEVAEFIKAELGKPVRLNTNGLGDLVNGRPIAPLLAGKIDAVSISLNSSDPDVYLRTVRPKFGAESHAALLRFAAECAKVVPRVVMSTVATTISPEDEAECARICARLGVEHRIRAFHPVS